MNPCDPAAEALAPAAATRPAPSLPLLAGLTALAPFTLQIVVPCLPAIAVAFAAPYAAAQLALTLYLAGVALGQLLLGPLSDRFGRRPLLRLGLSLYLGGSLMAVLAPDLPSLLVGRMLQALGACAGLVLARAIIRDCYGREQAASLLGYVSTVMAVAPMLSPLLGGGLEIWAGWRAAMLACAVLGLPLLLAALQLPETLAQPLPLPGVRGFAGQYAALLRLPGFRGCTGITGCSTAVFFAFSAGAPLVVEQGLGLAAASYGLAFVLIALAWAAGAAIAGRQARRLGVPSLLHWGVAITTAGATLQVVVALLLPSSLLAFFTPMIVVALGNGMTQPPAIAAAVSLRPDLAGTAAGLAGAGQMACGALGTLVAVAAEAGTGLPTALVMLVFALFSHLALPAAERAA